MLNLTMLKVKLKSKVSPKIFWPSIIILLIACTSVYILKEKEKSLRISTEEELNRTIKAKKVVENNLAEAEEEIAKRERQIELTLNRLEREITARKETEAQLISVIKEKRILEAKVEELTPPSKSVELEKIVIKRTPELTGKVLALDKEHSFIVVDLGSMSNLRLGDILSVYRNDKFIGRVQVEKIEEQTSAAVILPKWQGVEFKESDVVKKL